jgi:Putative esterase
VGLTSLALLWLLAVVAASLLVAIVVFWWRLAGPGIGAVALRFGSLLTLQAVVLALIFVMVNRTAEFYSSWSDLFGTDRAHAAVVAASSGAAVGSAAPVQPVTERVAVTGAARVRVPGDAAAAGTVEAVRFRGQQSGLTVAGHIFLPAGYRADGKRGRRYPVIVAITGQAASTGSPYGVLRLAQNAARLIAAGQLPPMIIVMLPAHLQGRDDSCLDVPAARPFSRGPASRPVLGTTFFAADLPAALEQHYQASSDPAHWALLADSSGGYCALQLALTRSWVYSTAVVPDAGYTRPPGAANTNGSPLLAEQYNLQWLLQNQPMQPVSVLFTRPVPTTGAGAADVFVRLAREPMRVSTVIMGSGPWSLSYELSWIGRSIGSHTSDGVAS